MFVKRNNISANQMIDGDNNGVNVWFDFVQVQKHYISNSVLYKSSIGTFCKYCDIIKCF